MITLHFVRHGESTGNVGPERFCGRVDPELTTRGWEQALRLGKRFQGVNLAASYTSPSERARKTVEIMGLTVPMSQVAELVERSYGNWDGRILAEIQQLYPEDFDDFEQYRVLPKGAEDLRELEDRVKLCSERLRALLEPGSQALVMTHKGVIQALIGGVLGLDRNDQIWHHKFQVDHGSITTIEWHDHAGPRVVCFNETGHLRG